MTDLRALFVRLGLERVPGYMPRESHVVGICTKLRLELSCGSAPRGIVGWPGHFAIIQGYG